MEYKTVSCYNCKKEFRLPTSVKEPFYCCRSPSVHNKVYTLTKNIAAHAANGFRTNSDIGAKRLSICQSCEFLDKNICRQCGCNMDIKAYWITSRCPLEKW